MTVNTPAGTDTGPLSDDEGVEKLAGILADNSDVTPDNLEVGTQAEAEDVETVETVEPEAEPIEAVEDEVDGETYETEPEAQDEPEDIAVEINGETISLEDVGKGYLRQDDYTRKTQDLAAQRKALEVDHASLKAEREHLQKMLSAQSSEQFEEPDWVAMAEEDPLGYMTEKAKFDAKRAAMDLRRAEQQRLNEADLQERNTQLHAYVRGEQEKILKAIPALGGDGGSQYKAGILTYMQGQGFSKDELAGMYDSRAVVLADKARKYDALMSKKAVVAKKVKGKPKVLRPGVSRGVKGKAQQAQQQARSQLRKSGSVNDAVNALIA